MSFPAFKFTELIREDWDSEGTDDSAPVSTFKEQLEKRFLIVVFQCANQCKGSDTRTLKKVFFWTMPESLIESEIKRVWLRAVAAVKDSDEDALPKSSESEVAHVRPHGRKGKDVFALPDGTLTTKRCFWLNIAFLKKIILEN